MLKDSDHEHRLCSLVAACSDLVRVVLTLEHKMNSDFQTVQMRLNFAVYCMPLLPEMVYDGHRQGNETRAHRLQYVSVRCSGNE